MFGTRRWKVSWGSLCSNRELLALASHWYWLILEEVSCMLLEVCPQFKYSKVSCPRCPMIEAWAQTPEHRSFCILFSLVALTRLTRQNTGLQTGWSLIVYSNGVRVRAALAAAWRGAWQPPRSAKLSTFLTRVCPCHDVASRASDVQPWLVSALPGQWSGCGPCTCKCNRQTHLGPCSLSSSRLRVLLRSHHHRQKNLFLLYRNCYFQKTNCCCRSNCQPREGPSWIAGEITHLRCCSRRWRLLVFQRNYRHLTEKDTGGHCRPHRQWLSRRNSNDELVFNGCSSEHQTPLH